MSLLEQAYTSLTLIDKKSVSDGMGGILTTYVDGATFDGALTKNTSTEMEIAERQGVKAIYNIITKKNITLSYHDIVRRNTDGKIFRVTSDGLDDETPKSANLNARSVTAEEWELPNE